MTLTPPKIAVRLFKWGGRQSTASWLASDANPIGLSFSGCWSIFVPPAGHRSLFIRRQKSCADAGPSFVIALITHAAPPSKFLQSWSTDTRGHSAVRKMPTFAENSARPALINKLAGENSPPSLVIFGAQRRRLRRLMDHPPTRFRTPSHVTAHHTPPPSHQNDIDPHFWPVR
jgi:hypothetical protein